MLGERELQMTATTDAPQGKPSAIADPTARAFLRQADPVLARVIDAHPDFQPRAWLDSLPPFDAFGTLIFQVVGQQLSVAATRTIVSRIEQSFGGRLPPPAEALAADPQVLRSAGLSARKGATIRAGRRTGSCWLRSTGPTSTSPATSRCGARSSASTASTTFRPRTSSERFRTAGVPTGASR